MNDEAPLSATLIRWCARILSAIILVFWGLFLFSHLTGDEGRSSRPLTWEDTLMLTALVVSLTGLALAWKWERAGATITLIAVLVSAAVNWKVVLFPSTLIPVTAVLYLFSWWISRRRQDDHARPHPTG